MLSSDKEHKFLLSVRHTTKTLILSSGPEQLHIPCGSQWLRLTVVASGQVLLSQEHLTPCHS